MTIYIPLYLVTEIGFSWDTIGSIIAVGLLAYVICEWPVGILADKWWGEKEMMAVGFFILAITSVSISFAGTSIAVWMTLFFISRIGAALVESTTESYFFKHMKGDNAGIISFFRLLSPLSNLGGSLLGALALFYLPFNYIFVVLGLLMVPGIFFTLVLKDTK